MDHDDEVTLEHIRQAGQSIERFLMNISEEAFLANEEKQSAVQHQILIIGEAATRLSQAFRDLHPTIPWTSIIGMRNRLIHGYDTVLLERVGRSLPRMFLLCWSILRHYCRSTKRPHRCGFPGEEL